jgi:hypothetical protein
MVLVAKKNPKFWKKNSHAKQKAISRATDTEEQREATWQHSTDM